MISHRQFTWALIFTALVTLVSSLLIAGAIYYGLEGSRVSLTTELHLADNAGAGGCCYCQANAAVAEPTATPTPTAQVCTGGTDLPTADPTATKVGPGSTATPRPTDGVQPTETPGPTDTPTVPAGPTVTDAPPAPTPTVPPEPTDKPKCNKGGGNDSEGCDPGNHPDTGNDDEGEHGSLDRGVWAI